MKEDKYIFEKVLLSNMKMHKMLFDVVEDNYERACDLILHYLHKSNEFKYKNSKWVPVSEKLPEDNKPKIITWVNRKPEDCYKNIKDKPFTATGVYYKGDWYWWSTNVERYLAEYGEYEAEKMNKCIEVIAWQDLPAPYGANQ